MLGYLSTLRRGTRRFMATCYTTPSSATPIEKSPSRQEIVGAMGCSRQESRSDTLGHLHLKLDFEEADTRVSLIRTLYEWRDSGTEREADLAQFLQMTTTHVQVDYFLSSRWSFRSDFAHLTAR
jgi:hypothetical protein